MAGPRDYGMHARDNHACATIVDNPVTTDFDSRLGDQ